MKIAYDGKRAVRNLTGLGNYSRLVIETMAESMPDSDHLVYVPEMRPNIRLEELKKRDNVLFRLPDRYWAWPKSVWRSWGVTAQAVREGADIYHGLSNELPMNLHRSPIASVVTIHDVIYRRMPECYNPIDRQIYDLKYGFSARHADRVIAISEATKKDIMELYDVPEKRIEVIRQGCSPLFFEVAKMEQRRETRSRYKLPSRYLLQVGTIERRKNLELTLRALSSLPDDIHLVAVGKGGAYLKQMTALALELGVSRRFHVLSGVPMTDLPTLYQMALANVYPSHYEGFGLPVLESLASGIPTITSNTSALPEAGGEAAYLISPNNVRAMVQAVEAIARGGDDLERRRHSGKLHAASFASTDIAARIHDVYEAAIAAHKK